MIFRYDEFCQILENHLKTGDDYYLDLLMKIINYPERYSGIFRLSNIRSKLIQNLTQSREIKFGDILEELTTEYIARLGYQNFDKNLGRDENGDDLNVDQYFSDGTDLFLVEMKVRDDHDSSKKRGQFQNFQKKVHLVRQRHPDKHIEASMWFVDDTLIKNKNYYLEEMNKMQEKDVSLHLYYGGEFFDSLKGGKEAWDELTSILRRYRVEHSSLDSDIQIPDFGSSSEIYQALLDLPDTYWKKLMSDTPIYSQIREELFSSGDNLEKAMKKRQQ